MHVEIWSDIACPWCYVGKRRFEAALAEFEHRDDVAVTWRSFELDPGAPAERTGSYTGHIANKYGGTEEEAQGMVDAIIETAAGDGLDFRFDRIRPGVTFDAHRVVHLAEAHGLQDAMKERLLRAYLSEGELMSDHATLARLAVEVGLPEDEVGEMLAGDRFEHEVRHDERTAAALGISAVPFFVIDREVGASGAHPKEAMAELLRRGWAASHPGPVVPVASGGDACGPGGC